MATPPTDMSGKGLLYVHSRITSDLLDEPTLLKWYDEDHIPEILATSGITSAIRFIDEAARAKPKEDRARPYLHVYPLQDLGFLLTPEFAKIAVTSEMLPGSKLVYDLVDFDVRYYSLVQVFDPTNKGPGHTRSVFLVHFALKEGYPSEDLNNWYRDEHLPQLAAAPGYLRSTRYKLVWGRNSETSRAFKGLAGSNDTAPGPARLPEWFALHEFETGEVDVPELQRLTTTEWTKKIFANCDDYVLGTAALNKAHGDQKIFNGEKI
ncbi:uncharacterized protein B0I36DRAFT_379798 [Microdochium trichocladiopsis]|uniref:Uncharacterized protein n=1 Tax=Microdochium trichocladiopsis TaxID=1682393 RepID=A0A9P8YI56_9PEZI|nr:uncharacterized protein B0I36DRAFT_379798 [Microdochium trichocladiopsis]KAH7040941.1 hypothetical protein B0I36DRAFT_379798 [Microdochium trichocladiopsis]